MRWALPHFSIANLKFIQCCPLYVKKAEKYEQKFSCSSNGMDSHFSHYYNALFSGNSLHHLVIFNTTSLCLAPFPKMAAPAFCVSWLCPFKIFLEEVAALYHSNRFFMRKFVENIWWKNSSLQKLFILNTAIGHLFHLLFRATICYY